MRRLLPGIATAVFLLIAPAAKAGWLPPVDISVAGDYVGGPQVVLDSAGNATAVWDRWNGVDMAVESAYRPAGAGWQAPVDLSGSGTGEGESALGAHNATSPHIAVDGDGDTTVVWERYAGTNRIILQATHRPAGGSWQPPVDIGEVKTMWAPEPWIAVDEEGGATATWTNAGVIESAHRPAGGSWQPPVPISDPGSESYTPEAAVNAQGDATAVWMHFDGADYVVQSAYRPAGGSWEAPTLVSEPGEEGGNPHIALGPQGDVMVIWRGESEEGEEAARAAYRSAGESWQQPTDVSVPGDQVQAPRVSLDADGNAIAVWASSTNELGGYAVTQAAYRPAGGSWEEPTDLSEDGGNAFPADVAFDTSGNAAVVMQRSNGTDNVLQGAYRSAGGEWEEPVDVSEEGSDAMNAVVVLGASGESGAANGVATAVWISASSTPCGKETSCSSATVQAAGYDAFDSPADGLEVPETAVVGDPVEISVPPANIWSPLLDFGDGTTVADTSATHSYSQPGEYTVTFKSTEVLGYPSVAQRTITVGSGEGPPDPPPAEGGAADPVQAPSSSLPEAPGAGATPPSPPSEACAAAGSARERALRQLKLTQARLKGSHAAPAARRLRSRSRRQAAALRQATRMVGGACGLL